MPEYIAPYITTEEYRCSHCGKLPPSLACGEDWMTMLIFYELFHAFALLRELWGGPIKINSGYRCPVHNLAIGGSYNSTHMFGAALDADFHSKADVLKAYGILHEGCPDLRIGVYTETGTFLHMDTGYHIFPRAEEDWVEGARWFK